jgi:hypothetical protein
MQRSARIVAAAALLAILGWSSVVALESGGSETLAAQAANEMLAWRAGGARPPEAAWRALRERLARCATGQWADPNVHEVTGVLLVLRPEHAEEAVGSLRRALALRPGSAYTWSYLAEAQYLRGDSGATLATALRRAAALGPAEPGVQRIVVDYGLAVWDEVDPMTHAAIDGALAAGLRRDPAEILHVADRRGRLAEACRHLAAQGIKDARWTGSCPGGETKP